jgi:hypothetical protein
MYILSPHSKNLLSKCVWQKGSKEEEKNRKGSCACGLDCGGERRRKKKRSKERESQREKEERAKRGGLTLFPPQNTMVPISYSLYFIKPL